MRPAGVPGGKNPAYRPVGVDQVDDAGMIDLRGLAGGLGVPDLVGEGEPLDGAGFAGQADQPRVKERDIAAQLLGRIRFGIDGDEQRLHRLARRAELVDRRGHRLQVDRADVRAEREAEIDQQRLAAEVGVGARRAGVIDQRERPADRLAVPHQRVHQLGGRSLRRIGCGACGHSSQPARPPAMMPAASASVVSRPDHGRCPARLTVTRRRSGARRSTARSACPACCRGSRG